MKIWALTRTFDTWVNHVAFFLLILSTFGRLQLLYIFGGTKRKLGNYET